MPDLGRQLAAVALLFATTGATDAAAPIGDNRLFVPPVSDEATHPVDPGQDCIALHRVRSIRIIAGEGIVYESTGRKPLINRPRHGVQRLLPNQILITRTSGALLCAGDIVHLSDDLLGMTSGFVALGKFESYQPESKD